MRGERRDRVAARAPSKSRSRATARLEGGRQTRAFAVSTQGSCGLETGTRGCNRGKGQMDKDRIEGNLKEAEGKLTGDECGEAGSGTGHLGSRRKDKLEDAKEGRSSERDNNGRV